MLKKALLVLKETVPVFLMVGLIPFVSNDYLLLGLYLGLITLCFFFKIKKHDFLLFFVGFFAMTLFEALFILTGVEVFIRNSFFGIMPLWLPLLWAYGFVVMKRSIEILIYESRSTR